MPNNSASDWDISSPANPDVISDGAKEIRVLREGTENRLKKEHVDPDSSGVGGEHLAGSAKTYIGNSPYPTNRPDGVTPLGSDDAGRLLVCLDQNNRLVVWDGIGYSSLLVDLLGAGAVAATGNIANGIITAAKLVDGTFTDLTKFAAINVFQRDDPAGPYTNLNRFANGFWTASDFARNKFDPGFLGNTAVGYALMAAGYIQKVHMGFPFPRFQMTAYTGTNTSTVSVPLAFDADLVIIIQNTTTTCFIGFGVRGSGSPDSTMYWSDGVKTTNFLQWSTGGGNNVIIQATSNTRGNFSGAGYSVLAFKATD